MLARVGNDVAFPMENLSVPREQIWPRVGQALEEVGLGLPFDHPTSALSGGQKQRLALAAILAMRPGLLILDEPTASLDPVGVAEVRDAVEGVLAACGATLVVVEHRVDVWAGLVDRIIVILGGRIAADGPVDRILAEQGSLLKEQGIWLPGDDVAAAVGAPEKRRHETSPSDPILSVRGLTTLSIPFAPESTLISPEGNRLALSGRMAQGNQLWASLSRGFYLPLMETFPQSPETPCAPPRRTPTSGAPPTFWAGSPWFSKSPSTSSSREASARNSKSGRGKPECPKTSSRPSLRSI